MQFQALQIRPQHTFFPSCHLALTPHLIWLLFKGIHSSYTSPHCHPQFLQIHLVLFCHFNYASISSPCLPLSCNLILSMCFAIINKVISDFCEGLTNWSPLLLIIMSPWEANFVCQPFIGTCSSFVMQYLHNVLNVPKCPRPSHVNIDRVTVGAWFKNQQHLYSEPLPSTWRCSALDIPLSGTTQIPKQVLITSSPPSNLYPPKSDAFNACMACCLDLVSNRNFNGIFLCVNTWWNLIASRFCSI